MDKNIARNENFSQVCVWPGTVLKKSEIADFTKFFLDEFKTRVQHLETIVTGPDLSYGDPVPGTGGRHDLFFAVHKDDISRFALQRLALGIRWIEDVYSNDEGHLYPQRVQEYCSWDAKDEGEGGQEPAIC